MGITFSTPRKTSSGVPSNSDSSPITPIMVLSFPFDICTARPRPLIFSVICSICSLVASGFYMIIVLKPDATKEQIEHITEKIKGLGLAVHISKGKERTIMGVIGDESLLEGTPLEVLPG